MAINSPSDQAPRRVLDTRPRIARWTRPRLALLLLCCAGCTASPPTPPVVTVPAPVLPWQAPAENLLSAAALNTGCLAPSGPAPLRHGVTELVLTYVGSGRDFRAPPGPDGYVLRVIPLDSGAHPRQQRADATIALFPLTPSGQLSARPLRLWHIPARSLARFWVRTQVLDGYLFRLDWADPPVPPGRYALLVRMDYHPGDGKGWSVCRKIAFEDAQQRAASTASPTAQPVASGQREPDS